MRALQIAVELLFDLGPYALCALAGGYLEAKLGQKAATQLSAAKAELAALKAKL
jgi:hypothetical protein